MQRTVLYEEHKSLSARIVEFGGWEMPVQYPDGALAEHASIRHRVGVFDVSHMGRIRVRGERAAEMLDTLITSNIRRLRTGRARYGLVCNDEGGILDDVVVMRVDDVDFLVVCNAASWDRITAWITRHASEGDYGAAATITHQRDETAMMAVQGPAAIEALRPICDLPLEDLARFACAKTRVADVEALISRTGYTGEDGFEIIVSASDAVNVWRVVTGERGVEPCGLAARDVLRLEAGLMLYGQDMDESVTPLEAGLDRFVDLETEFHGAEALRAQARDGVARQITGLAVAGRSAPRHGYPVRTPDGRESTITSGTYSPQLGSSIALAYLPIEFAAPGLEVAVDIRGRATRATTTALPFLK